MAEAYFLSAEDVKLVKELLAEKRSKRGNTEGRPGAQDVDHQEHQAPEVYVSYAPSGVTARSGTTPGTGQVYVYQTNISEPGTATLEDTYLDVTALNLSETAVDAGSYCLVHRTKDGQWYVQSPGGTAAECCGWCTDWWSRYVPPTGNQFHSSTTPTYTFDPPLSADLYSRVVAETMLRVPAGATSFELYGSYHGFVQTYGIPWVAGLVYAPTTAEHVVLYARVVQVTSTGVYVNYLTNWVRVCSGQVHGIGLSGVTMAFGDLAYGGTVNNIGSAQYAFTGQCGAAQPVILTTTLGVDLYFAWQFLLRVSTYGGDTEDWAGSRVSTYAALGNGTTNLNYRLLCCADDCDPPLNTSTPATGTGTETPNPDPDCCGAELAGNPDLKIGITSGPDYSLGSYAAVWNGTDGWEFTGSTSGDTYKVYCTGGQWFMANLTDGSTVQATTSQCDPFYATFDASVASGTGSLPATEEDGVMIDGAAFPLPQVIYATWSPATTGDCPGLFDGSFPLYWNGANWLGYDFEAGLYVTLTPASFSGGVANFDVDITDVSGECVFTDPGTLTFSDGAPVDYTTTSISISVCCTGVTTLQITE